MKADPANSKPICAEDLRTLLEFVSISRLWLWYIWSAATLHLSQLKKADLPKNQVWHPGFKPTISLEILFLHSNRPDWRPHFLGHLILCMDWFPNGTYSTFLKESTWCSAFSPMSKRNAEGDVVTEVWGVGETKRCWWNFPRTGVTFDVQVELPVGKEKKEKKEKDKKDKKVKWRVWIFKSANQKFRGSPHHVLISPLWGKESKCRQRRWRCC